MEKNYKVRDGLDVIEFVGERIGHASTRKPDKVRWTEVDIYRTRAGNYVVVRVGASVQYHRAGSKCASGITITGYQIGASSEPCDVCDPDVPEDVEFNPEESFVHEVTRSQADVVEDAESVRRVLEHANPSPSTPRLSWVAREALRIAAAVDPALEQSSREVRHVD